MTDLTCDTCDKSFMSQKALNLNMRTAKKCNDSNICGGKSETIEKLTNDNANKLQSLREEHDSVVQKIRDSCDAQIKELESECSIKIEKLTLEKDKLISEQLEKI